MYVQGLGLKYGAEEKKTIQNALIKRGWFMYIALVLVRYSLEIQEQKKNPEKHNRGLGGHGNDTVKSVTSDILS